MFSIIKEQNLNKLYNDYSYLMDFESKIFLYYAKSSKNLFLPRYFLDNHPNSKEYVILWNDSLFNPKSIDIEFTKELRSEQQVVINSLLNHYDKNKSINGILKAKPGFGKTVCSAYLTATLKRKTLIILDNSKLVEQWTEAYLQFTTIKENQIGYIIGNVFDCKEITITMIQTLMSKVKKNMSEFYEKMRNEGFDLVFFDETHKTSSGPKFALGSLFLNTKNIIGLSATPYGDSLHKFFMQNIIGDILFDFTQYDTKPEVYFINYKSGLNSKYFWKLMRIGDYIKRISFYNQIITNSPVYLDIILKLCKKLILSNRKTIIIVYTIEQLQTIITKLKEHEIPARPLYSKSQYIDKENDLVIVATYKLASHGFDHKDLSCLILAIPLKGKVSLIQTIGRILRKSDGKKNPLVFDLIDHDFGNVFTETIGIKKNIIKKEFDVTEFKEIDFNI